MGDRDNENEVRVILLDQDSSDDDDDFVFEGDLDLLIEKLTLLRDKIPEECRASASFEITGVSGYDDNHYANIEIKYFRPMTDAEIAERDELRRARQRSEAQRVAQEHAHDVNEFRRLGAKLGVTLDQLVKASSEEGLAEVIRSILRDDPVLADEPNHRGLLSRVMTHFRGFANPATVMKVIRETVAK